ncbi:MAG: Holliday junction resolvase RuvX [Actinomycetota bacterium]
MRILGLDIGDKRVGLAITDKNSQVASPLMVLENNENIKENIKKIIKAYGIRKIVVGIPYNLKGETGHQAKKTLNFIDLNLSDLGIEIIKADERFTSKIPKNQLQHLDKSVIDKYSACILLNDYLTKKLNNEKN